MTGIAAGLYPDLDEHTYHADPALSASGAKTLVRPGGPARYHHDRQHGRPPRDTFDFGHVAHKLILGAGADITVLQFDDWRTKAASKARREAYEAGLVPILGAVYAQARDLADEILMHPVAGKLLDGGDSEVSAFWHDDEFDIDRRARFDCLRPYGRARVVDVKTAESADPDAFSRAVANYGYHQQADWYLAAGRALGLFGDDAEFVFVVAEKKPPHLVNVIRLDAEALRVGAERNRRAMEIFRDCTEADVWPGYPTDTTTTIGLPRWAARDIEETW